MEENLGDYFICVDQELLAAKTAAQLSECEKSQVVGVGTSGYRFARGITPGCLQIPVQTIEYSREREKRSLKVIAPSDMPEAPTLIDDVVVSGQTLGSVSDALGKQCLAAAGLLFRSKRTRKRANASELRAGLIISRDGGGYVPINSISSLRESPERLITLTDKYFAGQSAAFNELLEEDV